MEDQKHGRVPTFCMVFRNVFVSGDGQGWVLSLYRVLGLFGVWGLLRVSGC